MNIKTLKLLVLNIALIPVLAQAGDCGDYLIAAEVKMINGLSTLVVNPGTKSEINLKVEFNESAKLSPYIDRFIEVVAKMEVPMDETRGSVTTLGTIKVLPPNPLATSKGTSMKLINKRDCIKP